MSLTIVFDFDGTLADSWEVTMEEVAKYAREKLGREPPEEYVDWFRSLGATKASRMVARKEGWSVLTMIRMGMEIQRRVKEQEGRVHFYPGVVEMIRNLKERGYILGLASANTIKVLKPVLRRQGVYSDFSFITWGRSFLGKKRILSRMLKRQHLEKEAVIYVGDQVRDIEAAHKVGIKIIAVTWGFNYKSALRKYDPEWLAASPPEVVKIIRGLE